MDSATASLGRRHTTCWGLTAALPPPARPAPPLPATRSPCRQAAADDGFAPVAPPDHPTYDVYAAIDAALAEDAGDFGDISTQST